MQDIEDFLKDLNRSVIIHNDPDLGRAYDLAIMPAVKQLRIEIKKQQAEQDKIQDKRAQAIASNQSQDIIEDIDESSGDCVDNQILLEQQMAVIAEMRLVYLYKSYEIELKRILDAAYHAATGQLFKWEQQIAYLNSRNVDVKLINGYKETNELRVIVNNIKHGGRFGDMLHPIPWQTDHLFCWQRNAAHAFAA
jgi:hypothetical protein